MFHLQRLEMTPLVLVKAFSFPFSCWRQKQDLLGVAILLELRKRRWLLKTDQTWEGATFGCNAHNNTSIAKRGEDISPPRILELPQAQVVAITSRERQTRKIGGAR